jgi:hypothetical protein
MPGDRMPHLAPRPIRRFAPRNDNRAVIPRACGGSITPRPLGSSINRQPRHCERSEAIHVTAQRKNGLLRFARKHLRLPAARLARALQIVSPKEKRAQGTPGACCTRGLACKKNNSKRTRAYRYSRSIPASLRNGFTAYAVLSSATNSSCHRHRRIEGFVRPGWARKTSANLTPATGARTTQFCRTPQHRSSSASSIAHEPKPTLRIQSAPDAAASTASHPNVSDDPDTPPREG